MNIITINPHNCSREEYAELIKYLEDNCWDYREITPPEEEEGDSGDFLSDSWLDKADDWREHE
jgi:hypothetical protein